MIISRKHEFIFAHIPKTAGSSIREALIPYAGMNPFWHQVEIPALGPGRHDKAHILAKDWRHFPLLDRNRHFFTFAVKRNPYYRFVSAYHQGLYFLPPVKRSYEWQQKDINERLPSVLKGLRTYGHKLDTIHLVPQCEFIYEGNKCITDFVANYESLNGDIEVISEMIGVPITIGKSNTSPKRPRPLQLSQQLVDEINILYEWDFMLFGYEMYRSADDVNKLLAK